MEGLTKIAAGAENVGITERPEPKLIPGHVVLDVQAAGICGTDIHIVDDEFRSWPPVTMGHEVCGIVAAVGDGVDEGVWAGRRVVSETYFSTCGRCTHCLGGRRNLCHERRSIGSAVDGAFAPRILVPAANLHVVPDWLPSEAAALTEPLACVCQSLLDPDVVMPGDSVLVVGPGPIGLITAQVARASGGEVHVRGTATDSVRLTRARESGFVTSVVGDELGTFDVVIECSGSQAGMTACLEYACRGGRYVQVGLAGKPVTLPFDEVCFRELVVTGGNASTTRSWDRALGLIEARSVDLASLVTEVVPLADWQRAFAATRSAAGVKFVLEPG